MPAKKTYVAAATVAVGGKVFRPGDPIPAAHLTKHQTPVDIAALVKQGAIEGSS